jgi:thymidine kinase
MPNLLAKADYITKLHAICMKCGNIANYSYRKVVNPTQLMLGEKDIYEPRCRKCYFEGK